MPARSTGCGHSPGIRPGTTAELRVAVPPSAAAGSGTRPYWLHVPAGYTPGRRIPLILALHGGNGTALGEERGTGLSALADREGFLAAYPQGMPAGHSGGAWRSSGPRDPLANGIDDGLYIARMLTAIQAGYCADPSRIAAAGFSNGAGMVGYLACVLSGRISAFAPVEAAFYQSPYGCRPAHPPSILDVHSISDPAAPYAGVPARSAPEYYAPSIPAWLSLWVSRDGCRHAAVSTAEPAHGLETTWAGCDDSAVVSGYRIANGGHAWPKTLGGINGSEFIVRFFARHPLRASGTSWTPHPAMPVPPLAAPRLAIGWIRQFRLPSPNAEPVDVAADRHGNIWFTEFGAGRVGRISPNGALREYRLSSATAEPYQLALAPDGTIWFTEWLTGRIGRISPSGQLTEMALPSGSAGGLGITVARDGTVYVADQVGRIDRIASGGAMSTIAPPHGIGGTLALARGAGGSIWCTIFAGFYEHSRVLDQLGPDGRWTRIVTLPSRFANLDALAVSPDGGTVWFTDYGSGQIGELSGNHAPRLFSDPSRYGGLNDLAIGPDGAIWYTDQSGLVGRMTTSGAFAQLAVPIPGSRPNGIATGPGRTIWVAETGADAIARISLPPAA